jgi:SAM-dependent methyltransferase
MAKTEPFDEHSDDYEKWFDLNKFAYKSEIKAIGHFIPEDGKGIEIGIGSGLFAQPLGIEKGIEPSLQMRNMAEKRGLEVYDGVAENIPLEDDMFDYALMVTTICFVDDLEHSLKEVKRILKTGGRIIIGYVDKNSPIGKVYQENKQFSTFYRDAHFYSSDEIEAILQKEGFHKIEFVQTLFGKLKEIEQVQDFKPGYGEGSFVVVKAEK